MAIRCKEQLIHGLVVLTTVYTYQVLTCLVCDQA
jgi:hypothetical protein